ncbi:pre-rRNA-processing protein TSR2-like protein, partial [Trifolium medium]|nr:pre-rRNA-processing protein TSR2-like protein [Trifolium medium]
DDDSDENIIEEDGSANMDVDIQKSVSNLNSMNRTVNVPQPKVADEADDGWTPVSRRKNKGRKN